MVVYPYRHLNAGEAAWQRSLTDDYGDVVGNHGLGSSLATDRDAIVVLVCHDGPSYLLALINDPEALPPTHTDVSYGPHATNVLDLWKGRS